MDPLAHTLFGATMAEAGLKRKTAMATAALVIGANIPDVDGLAMLVSSDYALLVRRGWTHGILALMIWPFFLTGILMGIDRMFQRRRERSGRVRNGPPMNPRWLLGGSFLGVWSHPLLDWLNTYGVRLLMPFDETWFYGDTLFIIDPWFWLLTGAAVVMARSKSWKGITGWIVLGTATSALVVSAEIVPIAAKIVWGAGIGAIVFARWSGRFRQSAQPVAFSLLIAAILYAAFMYTGARIAVMHANNHLSEKGVEAAQVMPNPVPAHPLLRTGIAASETHYYRFSVNWMKPGSFEFSSEPIPIRPPDPVVDAAFSSPDLQGLLNWIRFPHYEVNKLDEGWRVIIRDLRYVHPDQEITEGIGMAIVDLDEDLQVIRVEQ